MPDRVLNATPKAFLLAHSAVWALVVLVWTTTWDTYWENSGPTFNNARRCLERVDALVDVLAEKLAIAIALSLDRAEGSDAAFFVTVLAGTTLVLGSVQWLALGKVAQVLGCYSKIGGVCLVVGLACWIVLPLIHWAYLTFA